MGSHISPFAEIRDIGGLLTINGFTMLTIVRKISITIRHYVIVLLGVLGWMRSVCSNASASYFRIRKRLKWVILVFSSS
jgi:hypothetical protein